MEGRTILNRKKGQRVYMLLEHEVTKEQKREYGSVESDEGLWDFVDVRFDAFPSLVTPVLSYYLFDAGADDEPF